MERDQRARTGSESWQAWALRVGLVLVLLGLVQSLPFWPPLERLEYDVLGSVTAPVAPAARVVVVGLDEPSLAALNQSAPLPRRLHAQLVDSLTLAGAQALGIDMLFGAPQTPSDDAALSQALQGPLPVVLASAEVAVHSSQVAQYVQTIPTVFPFAVQGSVAMSLDSDGVLRRAPEQDDALWRVLASAAGRLIIAPPPGALLRYYAPEAPLPYLHYTQALNPMANLPPGALAGQVVLLGQNTPVNGVDQFRTPLGVLGHGLQSGVFIHATALINGLMGDWIVPAPWWGPMLQAGLSVAAVAALSRYFSIWRVIGLSTAVALLSVMGSAWVYVAGVWWSAIPTLAGLVLHVNVGAAGAYLRERRRREQLRSDFARYLPPAVVDALTAADHAPALQGERRVLTLFFSDLAGFTAASEHQPPQHVAKVLNAYFSRMTHTVHQHGGTLDKFIGDAVMAFWNAPLPDDAHADRALACAQAMQDDMEYLRVAWHGSPFADLQLRIGVHTGEAAVGHLGSRERFTYTAVGDAVNTAARLESANKEFHTTILLSGATRAALSPQGRAAGQLLWLDTVVLAGRSSGLEVYTVSPDEVLVSISQAVLGHVQAGEWASAQLRITDWKAHAALWAPQWATHADFLSDRVQQATDAAALQPDTPVVFRARHLDKL